MPPPGRRSRDFLSPPDRGRLPARPPAATAPGSLAGLRRSPRLFSPRPALSAPPLRPGGGGGAFSSSWPSASLPRQLPRNRGAPPARNPPAPAAGAPPSPASRGRSVVGPPGPGARSCESLCAAAQAGRGEAALRFSLSLPPEAIRVLQRRSLEKQQQQQQRRPRGRTPRSASPDAAKRPLAGCSAGGGDLRALLQVSLLNERHRYDDVEYEEEADGLVRKCTEWLRGVESAAARDRADKLDTLPHLGTL
uniref:Proline rich 18 n=1 Tax=Podarcis muralis TaxID=64176 RepID=A0A670HU94_PODMU